MQQPILRDFRPGLQQAVSPQEIPDGGTPSCRNVVFSERSIQVRPGRESWSGLPGGTAGLRALAQFAPASGNPRLVGAVGTALYATNGADQKFSSSITMATSVDGSNQPRMAQFRDSLYLVDGALGYVRKMFNLAHYTVTGSIRVDDATHLAQVDDWSSVSVTSSYTIVTTTDHSAGTPGVHLYNRSTGAWVATYNPVDFHGKPIATIPETDRIKVLCLLTSASGASDVGLIEIDYTGAVVGNWPACVKASLTNNRDIAQDPDNQTHYYIVTSTSLQRWISGTLDGTFVPGVALTGGCGVCVDDDSHIYVLDSTESCVHKLNNAGTLVATFGEQYLRYPLAIRYCGGSILVLSEGQVHEFTTNGTFVGSMQRHADTGQNGSTRAGIAVGDPAAATREVFVSQRYQTSSPAYSAVRVERYIRAADAETYVTTLQTVTAPSLQVSINADVGAAPAPYLERGLYQFAASDATVENDVLTESQLGPISSLTLATDEARYLAVTFPLRTTGRRYFVYAITPYNSTWRLVASYMGHAAGVTPGKSLYAADFEAGLDYEQPVDRPPRNSTHVIEWKGRLVYAAPFPGTTGAADTLYISNLWDPDHVPQAVYSSRPSSYGCYLQVGTDGQPITGLAKLGSYLVVFKERSVGLYDGDGWESFHLRQAAGEHGCIVQEGIAAVESALIYPSRDSIWAFNGQAFEEIGERVRDTWAGFTAAQKTGARAVYDPTLRRYLLAVPPGTVTGFCQGVGLVLDFIAEGWAYWTEIPCGPYVYANRAQTPGLYAGDPWGPTATGKLYHAFAESLVTDEGAAIAWNWFDAERTAPEGRYKDVRRFFIEVWGAAATNSLVAYLRANGAGSESDTLTLTSLLPSSYGVPQAVRGAFALVPDVESFQFWVSGASTTAFRVRRVQLDVGDRGDIR